MESQDGKFPLVRDAWFPGIQVLASRMEEGSDEGLYLAAKGGTNGESHNHNDIGSFVVYCDGKPAFIDIGTGVYEKRTFSKHRYEIPQIQSLYHNLPIIGGEGQKNGLEFKAQDVVYACTDEQMTMTLNLRGAYPAETGIESWQRDFTFDRANDTVTVTDDFALTEEKEVQLVLITAAASTFADGEMTVTLDDETAVTASSDEKHSVGLGRCPKNPQRTSPLTHYQALPEPILAGRQEKGAVPLFCKNRIIREPYVNRLSRHILTAGAAVCCGIPRFY